MIKSISFINNNGDELSVELGAPETSGLWVKSIKGIGPGKADINITDFASSDGGIFNSARSDTRNITVTFGIVPYESGTGEDRKYHSVEEVRRGTYAWFSKKNNLDIIITLEETTIGSDGKINTNTSELYTNGYVESNEPDIFNKQETMAISIICPDPNFYMNGNYLETFSSTNDIFTFCTEFSKDSHTELDAYSNEYGEYDEYTQSSDTSFIPGKEYYELIDGEYVPTGDFTFVDGKTYYEIQSNTYFADMSTISKSSIYYDGEIEVGIKIELDITGEVSGLSIYKETGPYTADYIHLSDDAIIEVAGGPLNAGDKIIINTNRGEKSAQLIRQATPYNIMNALGKNPSWISLNKGNNVIGYDAESGSEYVLFSILYREAYEGV